MYTAINMYTRVCVYIKCLCARFGSKISSLFASQTEIENFLINDSGVYTYGGGGGGGDDKI